MFKHILVPIDGSPTSELAVDKAIGLARAFDSAVTTIYVVDPYPFTGVGALVKAAEDRSADLIVMGSHGRSGIEKLVLGSVAQRVVQHTQLPVLLVRA